MAYLRNGMGEITVWVNPDYIEQFRAAGIADPYAYMIEQHERILDERRAGCMSTPAMQAALAQWERFKSATPQQQGVILANSEFIRYLASGGTPEHWCEERGIAPYTYDPLAAEAEAERRRAAEEEAARRRAAEELRQQEATDAARRAAETSRSSGGTVEQQRQAAETARNVVLQSAAPVPNIPWGLLALGFGALLLLRR
jgi:hypothetical protein